MYQYIIISIAIMRNYLTFLTFYFMQHSFVKFLISSDSKTKPLEDTATVKLWKTVA